MSHSLPCRVICHRRRLWPFIVVWYLWLECACFVYFYFYVLSLSVGRQSVSVSATITAVSEPSVSTVVSVTAVTGLQFLRHFRLELVSVCLYTKEHGNHDATSSHFLRQYRFEPNRLFPIFPLVDPTLVSRRPAHHTVRRPSGQRAARWPTGTGTCQSSKPLMTVDGRWRSWGLWHGLLNHMCANI